MQDWWMKALCVCPFGNNKNHSLCLCLFLSAERWTASGAPCRRRLQSWSGWPRCWSPESSWGRSLRTPSLHAGHTMNEAEAFWSQTETNWTVVTEYLTLTTSVVNNPCSVSCHAPSRHASWPRWGWPMMGHDALTEKGVCCKHVVQQATAHACSPPSLYTGPRGGSISTAACTAKQRHPHVRNTSLCTCCPSPIQRARFSQRHCPHAVGCCFACSDWTHESFSFVAPVIQRPLSCTGNDQPTYHCHALPIHPIRGLSWYPRQRCWHAAPFDLPYIKKGPKTLVAFAGSRSQRWIEAQ